MIRRAPLRARPKYKPVALRRHHDRVASLGCLVCGTPATIHHVTGYADKMGRTTRDHWRVVPLCPAHHQIQWGPSSVEALGHRGFYEMHGIDLMAEAIRLADETQRKAA